MDGARMGQQQEAPENQLTNYIKNLGV